MNDVDFIAMRQRVATLELDLSKLQTQIISLRGLVNRKLSKDTPELSETIKSPDGLDGLR